VNAELVKYMENCWLATQVMFGYEFSRIAQLVGADYSQVRELWALDPRVSKWHTLVMEKPGFGGKCLPKDLAGIIAASEALGFEPAVLSAVKSENDEIRGGS
jgi:UDPglucose 6-dehydrogenase